MKKWKDLSKRTQNTLLFVIMLSIGIPLLCLMGILDGISLKDVLIGSAIGIFYGLGLYAAVWAAVWVVVRLFKKQLTALFKCIFETIEGTYYFLYSHWSLVLLFIVSMSLVIYGWYIIDDIVVTGIGMLLPIVGSACFMRRGCCG